MSLFWSAEIIDDVQLCKIYFGKEHLYQVQAWVIALKTQMVLSNIVWKTRKVSLAEADAVVNMF